MGHSQRIHVRHVARTGWTFALLSSPGWATCRRGIGPAQNISPSRPYPLPVPLLPKLLPLGRRNLAPSSASNFRVPPSPQSLSLPAPHLQRRSPRWRDAGIRLRQFPRRRGGSGFLRAWLLRRWIRFFARFIYEVRRAGAKNPTVRPWGTCRRRTETLFAGENTASATESLP